MRLLLHVCCGSCALQPVKFLQQQGFTVSCYFMNNNIHPLTEYLARREAMMQVAEHLEVEVLLPEKEYALAEWLYSMAGRENCFADAEYPENTRCAVCYNQRLQATAALAAEKKFDAFSTSLLYSKYQKHELLKKQAVICAAEHNTVFYYHDFREFWSAGHEDAKALDIYRQKYCACIFSEQDRHAKKLHKLQQKNIM